MSSLATESGDVYQEGSGSPLVLLHGFGGTWHMWKPVLPFLLKRHRVIVPTLPGHSGGVALQCAASPASIADALAAQLRSLGISQAHITGQSLGGYMAVEMARRDMARSVLCLSPGGAWRDASYQQALFSRIRTTFKVLPYLLPILSPFLGLTAVRKKLLQDEMAHGERVSAAELRDMLDRALKCPVAKEMLANGIPPVESLPPQIKTPIRVVWCEQDKVLPFKDFGQPFLDTLGLRTHGLLPGCGHNPMYDDRAGVANTILEFTQSVERATPL